MKDILLNTTGSNQTLKKFIVSELEPLQTITDLMETFESSELKRSKFNGQKMVLQAALNDLFGVTSAPFIIVETNQQPGRNTYFFEPSELVPVYFSEPSENSPVYIFESSELPAGDFDFVVKIPSGIYSTELERQVRAQTKLYKLAGPTFQITTY